MSSLLDCPVYGPRNDMLFLQEMNDLTEHHRRGCHYYSKIISPYCQANSVEELPFLHVGLFKWLTLKTESAEVKRERTLNSSATSGKSSRIALDARSSALQSRSSAKILSDFLGEHKRPLLIIDSSRSLRSRGSLTARVAAALSLKFLASEIVFLLDDAEDYRSMRWDEIARICTQHNELVVYGFSWILWQALGKQKVPREIRDLLLDKTVAFVHSGGWKKLEDQKVDRQSFDQALLGLVNDRSKVIDYYGLVEQIGIVYPLCEYGFRHVPVWADVIVRDSYTLEPLEGEIGQLQFLNTLAWGAPYHSVLTEDIGKIASGDCPCGRSGKRFHLLGRLPRAELRGCANV